MDRLRADFLADGGQDPFTSAEQPGVDPPDFVCTSSVDGASIGVEMTQLTFPERVGAQALFETTKKDVLAGARGRLRQLRGYAIIVMLADADGRPRLPARRGLADELLETLQDVEPQDRPPLRRMPQQSRRSTCPVCLRRVRLLRIGFNAIPGGRSTA
jgi:hypothetical protein